MCREYKLACLNLCVSCYTAPMMNLIWLADDKFLKPHKNAQSGRIYVSVGIVWLLHVRAWQCTSTQSLWDGWVSGSIDNWLQPPCCLVLTRWTFFRQRTRLSLLSEQGSNWCTSWDKQTCTHDTSWRQHYITTSKEYLTNCHTLLKYFELVFLRLQLVKILCKLIDIWENYKKGSTFCETPCRSGYNRVVCIRDKVRRTGDQVEMVWAYTTSRRRGLCQKNFGGRCSWTTEQEKAEEKVYRRRQVPHGGLAARHDGRGE